MMISAVSALHVVADVVTQAPLAAVPNPAPAAPPGSERLEEILSWVKWLALISAVAGFFAGLVVFAAGRMVDHRRAGSTGAMMVISSLAVGLLFGIGPEIITSMAGG